MFRRRTACGGASLCRAGASLNQGQFYLLQLFARMLMDCGRNGFYLSRASTAECPAPFAVVACTLSEHVNCGSENHWFLNLLQIMDFFVSFI